MILHFAVLVVYRRVTDRQMDGQTRDDSIYHDAVKENLPTTTAATVSTISVLTLVFRVNFFQRSGNFWSRPLDGDTVYVWTLEKIVEIKENGGGVSANHLGW